MWAESKIYFKCTHIKYIFHSYTNEKYFVKVSVLKLPWNKTKKLWNNILSTQFWLTNKCNKVLTGHCQQWCLVCMPDTVIHYDLNVYQVWPVWSVCDLYDCMVTPWQYIVIMSPLSPCLYCYNVTMLVLL
jgi:hypothetical protein